MFEESSENRKYETYDVHGMSHLLNEVLQQHQHVFTSTYARKALFTSFISNTASIMATFVGFSYVPLKKTPL